MTVAAPARADDYWLEFQPLQPSAGSELSLSLWLGKDFIPEAQQAMQQARTVALRHISRAGDTDLLPRTREGVLPLLRLRLGDPGGHLLSLERDTSQVQLRARTFNRYLENEGLLEVLAERKRAGEMWHRASERYTRYLKAFVQVGDVADGVSTKVVGQRLELVPERDLAGLKVGERLGMRVLFEGRPLANAQVEAFTRGPSGAPGPAQVASTDSSGRVDLQISEPGTVLVRTVHMQRCVGCGDTQWESFWSVYSFAAR
ncbi:MAG TPA: DUF4198 domain-containing protein [Nannocystis sp.]